MRYNPNFISDEELDRRAEQIHIRPQYHGIDPTNYSYRESRMDVIMEAYREFKELGENW